MNNAIATGASSVSKLKGKQKKLDVDGDGDIDGHDFKHLREKKSKKGKDVFEKAWDVVKDDGKRYKIVRNHFSDNKPNRTIKSNLTLQEAQAHCRNPKTSNAEAENPEDRWFDGYQEM